MKFLVIVALLPCALAQCPGDDLPPLECQGADLVCGGMPMEDGCPSPQWCMARNPYERCSSRVTCPMECLPTDKMCPGVPDPEGCPTQETCMPAMNGDCEAHCPVQCSEMEKICPGEVGPDGCAQPDFCIHNDPWDPYGYQSFCPVTCKENEMPCRGVPGISPDTCMPFDPESPCAPICPPSCNPDNEIYCSGPVDPETGCEYEGWCMNAEPTALCQHHCPMHCPPGEWPCYMGYDEMGCTLPEECSAGGVCPDVPAM